MSNSLLIGEMIMALQKKSFKLFSHPTSIALEPEFWHELKRIATEQNVSLTKLIENIDKNNPHNLASSLRVYVLRALKAH